jgi:hypothetical protein
MVVVSLKIFGIHIGRRNASLLSTAQAGFRPRNQPVDSTVNCDDKESALHAIRTRVWKRDNVGTGHVICVYPYLR